MNDYDPISNPKENKAMWKIWSIFYAITFTFMYSADGEFLSNLIIAVPASIIIMGAYFVIYSVLIEPLLNWIKK